MSKYSLLKYLVENFEKEKRALYEKREQEEQKLNSFFLSEKKRLEDEYRSKQEELKKELKKRLEKEYLEKEIEFKSKFEEILKEKISMIEKQIIQYLRNEDYEAIFEKFVKEIPTLELGKVIVNPKDIKLAKKFFPEVEILEKEEIKGGFVAFTKDELIKIDNTIEKRIEKAKEEILLNISKDVLDYLEKNYVDKNL